MNLSRMNLNSIIPIAGSNNSSNEEPYKPIGDNFLIDSFVINVDKNNRPIHYHSRGNLKIEAAHPYVKGFEGPYVPTRPSNAAATPDEADKDHPYYYSRYNKGPRLGRGGLASGWGGINDGHILKITYDGSQAKSYGTGFFLAMSFDSSLVALNKVRFQGYIKIVQGPEVGFGSDSGYKGQPRGYVIKKEITDAAPQGWFKIDTVINTSRTVSSLTSSNFVMGFDSRYKYEVYLALPRIQPIEVAHSYQLTVPQRTTSI